MDDKSSMAMENKTAAGHEKLRPSTRRLIQLYSALLHNAHQKGFIDGEIYQGKAKYACVPGLNCYSCPGAAGACPLGAIQNALASAGHRAGWYMMGIILLFGVTLGRTICGWLCPMGLIQELLHKIPVLKIRKSPVTGALSSLKYAVLAVFAVAVPLWYGLVHDMPMPGFCKYICPAGTMGGAISLLANPKNDSLFGMLGVCFTRKFIIMLAIFLACIFCYRSFCRFLCPLGAIYGLFNRFCLVGVRVENELCNGCGACVRSCCMDVRHVGDRECIHCAKCVNVCAKGAISFKAGKAVLIAPLDVRGKARGADKGQGASPDTGSSLSSLMKSGNNKWIVRGLALAVLLFALAWFNFLDPSLRAGAAQADPAGQQTLPAESAVGSDAGMQLPDFTMTCLDGTEFHLADMRGKVVFINLWATYCTPCVKELPYFDDLYREHEEDVAVLAVHSSIVTDDPADFLADKGWSLPFAVDSEDDRLWGIVNGSSTLPQTIVLDREGRVIYNQVGSVTSEVLAALYAQASGK